MNAGFSSNQALLLPKNCRFAGYGISRLQWRTICVYAKGFRAPLSKSPANLTRPQWIAQPYGMSKTVMLLCGPQCGHRQSGGEPQHATERLPAGEERRASMSVSTAYACVTGADRGLGCALALQLVGRGYTVFAGRYMKDWGELDRLAAEHPGRLIAIDLDVSSDDSVARFGATVAETTDRLELVVNNAGIAADLDDNIFTGLNTASILRMFNVNAVGPLRVTAALVPLLLNEGMKLLVNISSEAGQINQTWREGWYGYCMSKAALNIQSNIVHNELKGKGGRVLAIHPGWMKTYMSGQLNEAADLHAAEAAAHIVDTMLRHCEAETVHAHPAFLDYMGREMHW
jgi:NAD(P)-dependent dehydrogenase (short-subunit alcohol dehydrogenase family)